MNNAVHPQAGRQPAYHSCYRTVLHAVDARFDIRGYVLAEMVRGCLMNRATLPAERRAYFALCAGPEAMVYLEKLTASLLFGPKGRFSPEEYRYSRTVDLEQ